VEVKLNKMNAQKTSGQKTVGDYLGFAVRPLVMVGLAALTAATACKKAPTADQLNEASTARIAAVGRTTAELDTSSAMYGQLGHNFLMREYEASTATTDSVRQEARHAGYLSE
jgi:hypothetical protein